MSRKGRDSGMKGEREGGVGRGHPQQTEEQAGQPCCEDTELV